MLFSEPDHSNLLEILTAGSTALAAVFAAVSAWTSRRSAKAAMDTVKEARIARQVELAPKLILEKDFLDFVFMWPHPSSLNGEPVFLARKHWKDDEPTPPTFSLKNFGQSPALEVTIVLDIEDPNGDYKLPHGYENLGIQITKDAKPIYQNNVEELTYRQPDGSAMGLPLYHKWTIDIPNCSPDQKRVVEFPIQLLNTLFLRGLQQWRTMQGDPPNQDMILTAHLSCYAVDGTGYETQFRWKIFPFHHGETKPIKIYGHCFELPMYPKPDGPRVA